MQDENGLPSNTKKQDTPTENHNISAESQNVFAGKQNISAGKQNISAGSQKNLLITRPFVVCLLAGICCLLWGSAFPCVKIGYRLFRIESSDTASQILFAGCRFALAGLLVLIFAWVQNQVILHSRQVREESGNEKADGHNPLSHSPSPGSLLPRQRSVWAHILILSIFQTIIQYFFFYIGLAHTSGVKASIIEGTNVFVAILTASLIFRQEKLTLPKISGCLIGFLGVVLVNLGAGEWNVSFHLLGEGFIFLSTFAYAFSSVLMKNFSQKDNPVLLSGWQFLVGGLILAAAGGMLGGHIHMDTLTQAAMLSYLAFISAGAYTLWGILIKYNPVSQVSVYGFMNPVFGVILSFFLLHDSSQVPGLQSILALVLVCAGIYVVNKSQIQQ